MRVLDPEDLYGHIHKLNRAAWASCGSRYDAEDLVQETFLNILKRPRLLRDGNEIVYLVRALRNNGGDRERTPLYRDARACKNQGNVVFGSCSGSI